MGACGRADLTAESNDYLYVFELKVTDKKSNVSSKLEDAKSKLSQISMHEDFQERQLFL